MEENTKMAINLLHQIEVYLKKKTSLFLLEKVTKREGETETEIFHLLAYFLSNLCPS